MNQFELGLICGGTRFSSFQRITEKNLETEIKAKQIDMIYMGHFWGYFI